MSRVAIYRTILLPLCVRTWFVWFERWKSKVLHVILWSEQLSNSPNSKMIRTDSDLVRTIFECVFGLFRMLFGLFRMLFGWFESIRIDSDRIFGRNYQNLPNKHPNSRMFVRHVGSAIRQFGRNNPNSGRNNPNSGRNNPNVPNSFRNNPNRSE